MKRNFCFALVAMMLLCACSGKHTPEAYTLELPQTEPDYLGVTFAPNIAAPSFVILDEAEAYQTEIGIKGQDPAITIQSDEDGEVEIDLDDWHKLLDKAKGDSIYFRFSLKHDGKWLGCKQDAMCAVSPHPIDGYLVYRLIYPGYELWNNMGIYERNLTNYDQRGILENKDFDNQCVNCHNFSANNPEQGAMFHIRGKQGGTLISQNGKVHKIDSKFTGANHGATYPGWSRDGMFIAYSANAIGQVFHSSGAKPIEVVDQAADLLVYDVAKQKAYSSDSIMGPDWIETFPNWAPDGRTIYFCRAKGYDANVVFAPEQIQYDLCSVDFDPATCRFSNVKVLYAAAAEGKSVSFPRCSPDGRWLMFTRMNYGNFSIWHPESQLCLMDLTTGQWREMNEVNSNSIDSYHSWSSDGKWFVFSSKRMDGLWARPYIAAFDPATGRAAKPFCLPQKKALFYEEFTKTFNIPELITSPVPNAEALLDCISGGKAEITLYGGETSPSPQRRTN